MSEKYTLFDIGDDLKDLYLMAGDPDMDPEVIQGTIDAVMGALEVKSAGYVNVIKQLEMEAKQAKEVAQMFTDKAKVREYNIKRMKDALKMVMEQTDQDQIAAGDFTIKLQKNGGKEPLKITGDVPESLCKVTIEPDNDKIREYLQDHSDCEFAHLEPRGTHVVIK
jgi:hypothetical protein